MTNEDAIKWLENLKNDIGNLQHESLWHYAQAIDEIAELLKEQEAAIEKYVKTEFVRLLDDYSDDAFAKESAVEAMTDAFLHYELKHPLKEE